MTLPLPNLDDRTFEELFEEGRALIPRYSPAWTDHNFHDPGITLIELLAYLTDQELYRLNFIGEPHQRAFLGLLGPGFRPRGPRPATLLLTPDPGQKRTTLESIQRGDIFVTWQPAALTVPPVVANPEAVAAGRRRGVARRLREAPPVVVNPEAVRGPGAPTARFRARHQTTLTGITAGAVQVFDGRTFRDVTALLNRQQAIPVWGDDPAPPDGLDSQLQPALYLGLSTANLRSARPGSAGEADLTLWFDVVGPSGAEGGDRAECPEGFPSAGAVVVWEWLSPAGWVALPEGRPNGVQDETRAFTRSGRVVLPGRLFRTGAMGATRTVGAVPARLFYVRSRLSGGLPDAPPQFRGVYPDAVLAEQFEIAQTRTIRTVGPDERLVLRDLVLPAGIEGDVTDWSNELASRGWRVPRWGNWPVSYRSLGELSGSSPAAPGWVPLVVLGLSTGEANQHFALSWQTFPAPDPTPPEAPDDVTPRLVIPDTLRLWTLEPPWAWDPDGQAPQWAEVNWQAVSDLIASRRTDPAFVLDNDGGQVVFGDGEHGRVPPPGSLVVAGYQWTAGAAGNVAGGLTWRKEDVPAADVAAGRGDRLRNRAPASGGEDAEALPAAMSRLLEVFGAPEKLLALAGGDAAGTLDGLPSEVIRAVPAPEQAVTLVDFERLAQTVPGTEVRRARAWAEIDPALPGMAAPGTVTVVVVPALPADRPFPTAALLERVQGFLERRRPVASRVRVAGPDYVDVRVQAVLHVPRGTSADVRGLAETAVKEYLHPLRGGPGKNGWPFGRSVHAGEVLLCLQGVPGAQHVTGLRLAAGSGPWQEDAIPVGPQALVALAAVLITVQEDA